MNGLPKCEKCDGHMHQSVAINVSGDGPDSLVYTYCCEYPDEHPVLTMAISVIRTMDDYV